LALDKHMKSPIDHYYHAWRDAKITHRCMGLLARVTNEVVHQCLTTKNQAKAVQDFSPGR